MLLPTIALLNALLHLASAQPWPGELECRKPKQLPTPSYRSFFGRQPPVVAESPAWRVGLITRQAYAECGFPFIFKVTNKVDGRVSQFRLCNQTAQVDEIDFVSSDRALVLGRVGASSPVASIVELPSGRPVDRFGCQSPSPSPDHRYLAFVKDFPPHPGPVEISDEYLVYDLTRDADYNRPHSKPRTGFDAGWSIYPPEATNAVGENILPEGSPYHSMTSQNLFWLDEKTLAFSDFFEGHNRLVVVDLTQGVRKPHAQTVELEPSELVDLERCKEVSAPSDYEEWAKQPAGLIRITAIEAVPDQPGMACLRLASSPCLRHSSVKIRIP